MAGLITRLGLSLLRFLFWPILWTFTGRRIFRGLWWAVIWAIAGPIIGAVFGRVSGQPLLLSMLIGTALAAGLGFLYGLFLPEKKDLRKERHKTRFGPERCAWCKGSGVEGKKGKGCSVCDGQGQVLVEQPSGRCRHCRGKGRVWLGGKCKICDGAGWSSYVLLAKAAEPARKRWWRWTKAA
jgi:hypothetical protein